MPTIYLSAPKATQVIVSWPGLIRVELLRCLSLCWVKQAALIASDITLCDAVLVMLRVVVGHNSNCSGRNQWQQSGDSDATSPRACVFSWFVHREFPTKTNLSWILPLHIPNRVNTAYPRPYESVLWEGRQQSIRGNANRHSTKRFWWSFIENTHVSLTKHNSAFNKVTQSFDFLMFKRLLVTLFGLAITSPTKANQLV